MKKVKAILFSNGTAHGFWTERNCDRCWKQSRYNEKKDTYSQFRCSIDKDIQLQCAGLIEEDMVNAKSVEVVELADCPYREDSQKKYPKAKRKDDSQKTLFDE